MISLIIEEQDGDVNFKIDGMNTATEAENEVILSILQSMNNDFTIEKTEITLEQKKWQVEE
ncbi:hypothetical protein A9G42_05415 [Gilliamella sp. Nev6-6]|uniref:hypothetical protein n=1 Tax=Gilliamella sp. Nev6-6 TaxID=3120252 RepID=UPI00080F4EAE|nr:hypothetical protein [Gilliamella apicola]OCG77344.1 hypothetical protein A9G42_05415 [Gilliamella apicola]